MAYLSHFSENELYLDDMQASKVLDFFGFSTTGTMITLRDREFAQALLVARADNLGKGASGAAAQNIDLMLGLSNDFDYALDD